MVFLSAHRRRGSFICSVVLVDAGLQKTLIFEGFDKLRKKAMSSSKLIAHDGRYKFRGGKDYVSNFTMRLLYPVEVRSQGDKTDSSGYVGVATHKDGTEK